MSRLGVTVVIVNWNTREMVLRLLASLSTPGGESSNDLELIVVDNGSHDRSVEAIRHDFPNVRVVTESENHGFAVGVNLGLQFATKSLVLLLNSDAQTSPASIEEAAQYMEARPEVGILGPHVLSLQRTPQPSAWRIPSVTWMALSALGLSKISSLNFERYQDKRFTDAVEVECVSGCAMMLRRDLLEEIGGFDEDYFMYFEDTDLCIRARRHGRRVHHAPVGEFLHEEGGAAKQVRLRSFLDFRRSQILFHLKYGGVGAAVAARGLLVLASALRIPPLAVLAFTGLSREARDRLRLHWNGLAWLLRPGGGLVPEVDRST